MNMNQVKKIILVPFEEWEKIKTNPEICQEVHQYPMKNQKQKVKKQIHIQKIHLNQEKLPQNMTLRKLNKVNKMKKKKVKKKKIFQQGEGLNIDDIIKDLPNAVQLNARSLLLFIKDKKLMRWNDNGEIIFKTECLKKTNIKHLILHAVTKMKKNPIGYKCFYKVLRNEKIPTFLIKNNLRQYTSKIKSEMWRHPGEIENKNK